jgi:hypothetical protein
MPQLSLSLDRAAADGLCAFISDEPELAFILPDGPSKWRAVNRVQSLADGTYVIWHEAGGSLVLTHDETGSEEVEVNNPWAGWTESSASPVREFPGISSVCPWLFRLTLRTQGVVPGRTGVSELYWLGNRYRPIGGGAPASTQRCWNRLRRWFDRQMRRQIRAG